MPRVPLITQVSFRKDETQLRPVLIPPNTRTPWSDGSYALAAPVRLPGSIGVDKGAREAMEGWGNVWLPVVGKLALGDVPRRECSLGRTTPDPTRTRVSTNSIAAVPRLSITYVTPVICKAYGWRLLLHSVS